MTAFMNYTDFLANFDSIMQSLGIENLTAEEKKKIDEILAFAASSKWRKRESKKMENGDFYTISDIFDENTSLFYCKGVTQVGAAPEEIILLLTQTKYGVQANPLTESIRKLGPDIYAFDQRERIRIATVSHLLFSSREFLARYFVCIDRARSQAIYVSCSCPELEARSAPAPGCVRGTLHLAAFIVTLKTSPNGPPKTKNGPDQAKNENPTDKNGPLKTKNGPAKNENPTDKNGPLKTKNGPGEVKSGPGSDESEAPLSEVVYIVQADLKGWVPKPLLGLLRNSQTQLVANMTAMLAENQKRYAEGRLDDVLLKNILRRREEMARRSK